MGWLLGAHPEVDGCIWPSAQLHAQPSTVTLADADGLSVLLVEAGHARSGGITCAELSADGPAMPVATPTGLQRLDQVGTSFDVTVVRS